MFGRILKRVVAERGVGILLVEHDMALVMDVCDEIYVMDFGTRIFAGTPQEVRRSDVVRAAYLGTDAPELDQTEALAQQASGGNGTTGTPSAASAS